VLLPGGKDDRARVEPRAAQAGTERLSVQGPDVRIADDGNQRPPSVGAKERADSREAARQHVHHIVVGWRAHAPVAWPLAVQRQHVRGHLLRGSASRIHVPGNARIRRLPGSQ